MNNMMLKTDFYKTDHKSQYPQGTTEVYSTWIPRTSRIKEIDKVVFFGLQAFIKEYLIKDFKESFFDRDIKEICNEYVLQIYHSTMNTPDIDHIKALHKLGYLPIEIKALAEGTRCPLRVPMLTIVNTHPDFAWITNFLETLLSCQLWQPCTSATKAYELRKIIDKYYAETVDEDNYCFSNFALHDFSMRGMSSLKSAELSGMGHLLSSNGTDTIPAILSAREYYNADINSGGSVNATEHSVMCSYGKIEERETYRHLIEDVYPKGVLSIVSDTWDLWNVLTNIIPSLKNNILAREGKLVIRPDSGNPQDILCGDRNAEIGSPQYKGVIQLLWETFGGEVNSKGYKVLNPQIGAIYGDAITIERCESICEQLKAQGFSVQNVVFGIGSYTYQLNTRDTFGFAMKATSVTVNGEEREIFKNPITDSGVKKSLKGKCVVLKNDNNELRVVDEINTSSIERYSKSDMLKTIFKDGKLLKDFTFEEVKKNMENS